MKKNLDYYLQLNYPVEINKIPSDEGGGYSVCIPSLGRKVFMADGESIEEALQNLKSLKREWFEIYLQRGTSIPEPPSEEDEYSGKLLIRIPKQLHRHLDQNAKLNETSLNQYIQFLLASSSTADSFKNLIDTYCNKLNIMFETYKNIEYNIDFGIKHFNSEYKQPNILNLYRKTA